MINYNPKDVYEGQVAVYVHYKTPISVAVALRVSKKFEFFLIIKSNLNESFLSIVQCLNGLQMSDGNTLKCSFGTSKYCANYLAYA